MFDDGGGGVGDSNTTGYDFMPFFFKYFN